MKALLHTFIVLALTAAVAAVGCAPAWGAPFLAWNDKQVAPGITRRTIWGEAQVAAYALPTPVTHTGYIHVQLTYKPADQDLVLFLLDRDGHVCDTTFEQGQLGSWAGKEAIDYYVPAVQDQTATPEGVDPVRGDVYYLLVQALNGKSSYRLTGYYPRLLAGGTRDTTAGDTLRRGDVTVPAKSGAWATVSGAPYGGPFDLYPTSQGLMQVRLEYPAAAAMRPASPLPAPTAMPAAFDQYVAVADYTRWPVADDDRLGLSHWDLAGLNRHESGAPAWNGVWYGLDDSFTVQWGDDLTPISVANPTYHFAPALRMVASSAALGPASPPATGRRTVGYKATLLIPQHLFLKAGKTRVRRGRKLVLKGSLAIAATPDPAATMSWAPAGTPVLIERRAGTAWRPVRVVLTRAAGAWSAVVRPRATTRWRARWLGAWQGRAAVKADGGEAAPVWVRPGDQLSAVGASLIVTVAARGVTFTLASGAFGDGTASVVVGDGASVTRTLQGHTLTFTVVKGSVRRGDECSVARRIVVVR
jgi:hypothetical protein